jgi:PAT family beta-lactamase induction signal transducer AmpG
MPDNKPATRNPWTWVPSLYVAEGLPYVLVMTVSVVMYKGLGLSNTDIALYTSWLYLPWVIKPLWSPVVDILRTRRWWIWTMQLLIGAGLAGVALTIPAPNFVQYTLAFFYLLAFSSATHDIAADGYYLLATTDQEQAFFVGIRSTFYRISMISGQGLLVIFAGLIQSHTGLPKIDLIVVAKADAPILQQIENWKVSPSPAQREIFVVTQTDRIEIKPTARSKKEISELIAAAKSQNSTNGFYKLEEKAKSPGKWSQLFDSIGRFFSAPFRGIAGILEPWLHEHFGSTKKESDEAGNVGVVQLQLSSPPGRETIVTLNQKSGGLFGFFKTASKSVSVPEGARLIFNDQNWNKPAAVVFQLHPKQKQALTTTYEIRSGNIARSWSLTFWLLTAAFVLFAIYHKFILPHPGSDQPGATSKLLHFTKEFLGTFGSFFAKPKIGFLLLFLLLYRFGEAQLVKLVNPFLLDPREAGGLGLTTGQVGFVYGVVGLIALTFGGLLGGLVASKQGLKFWLWPMVLAIHLPDAAFIFLAYIQPENLAVISIAVAVEQFGYGFGFTAYMLYMIYIARGKHSTAHYAICTGFMAMSMMFPGMWSGWLQEIIGYQHFFVWVILATIPSFLVVLLVPLDKEFGKKTG